MRWCRLFVLLVRFSQVYGSRLFVVVFFIPPRVWIPSWLSHPAVLVACTINWVRCCYSIPWVNNPYKSMLLLLQGFSFLPSSLLLALAWKSGKYSHYFIALPFCGVEKKQVGPDLNGAHTGTIFPLSKQQIAPFFFFLFLRYFSTSHDHCFTHSDFSRQTRVHTHTCARFTALQLGKVGGEGREKSR